LPRSSKSDEIQDCLRRYETWLAEQTPLDRGALRHKHAKMAADRFSFFRGSLPRWCEQWKDVVLCRISPKASQHRRRLEQTPGAGRRYHLNWPVRWPQKGDQVCEAQISRRW